MMAQADNQIAAVLLGVVALLMVFDPAVPASAAAHVAAHVPRLARIPAVSSLIGHYSNGRIPLSALCSIGQGAHRLRCDAAADYRRLVAAARVDGISLSVTDSYRSYAAQVECRRNKGSLCAVPGTSNHGLGVAVDWAYPASQCGTTAHRWLERNAGRFGWLWPSWARPNGSKTECWHFQYKTDS